MITPRFIAQDPPRRAAKVRGASLPQEVLLSQLIHNISYCPEAWNSTNSVHAWPGVMTDIAGDVLWLEWGAMGLDGTLAWEALPQSLAKVDLTGNFLKGEVPLEVLPRDLQDFHIAKNSFHGDLRIAELPRTLQVLDVSDNCFGGTLSLEALPPTLTHAYVSMNQFTGVVNVEALPSTLQDLYLGGNDFFGTLDLRSTNPGTVINLSVNRFDTILLTKENKASFYIGTQPRGLKIVEYEG